MRWFVVSTSLIFSLISIQHYASAQYEQSGTDDAGLDLCDDGQGAWVEPGIPSQSSEVPLDTIPLGKIAGPSTEDIGCHARCAEQGVDKRIEAGLKAVDKVLLGMERHTQLEDLEGCMMDAFRMTNLEPLKARIQRKIAARKHRKFTIAIGGTSVTAGHDNKYSEAWPFQLQRFVKCAFAAAGVHVVVRNVAMGGNEVRGPTEPLLGDSSGADETGRRGILGGLPRTPLAATGRGDLDLAPDVEWEKHPMDVKVA
ncbi:hypothetical protein CYMTET_13646, partial [Cymbomonas tetramitiformis]